jgi:regulation of enolase protein 1 (concanavalin A-like superfamily)
MVDKAKGKAIATKIKKWLEAVRELNEGKSRYAISITRLTSIKSFCQDESASQQFALFMAKRIQAHMLASSRPEHHSPEEWQTFLTGANVCHCYVSVLDYANVKIIAESPKSGDFNQS